MEETRYIGFVRYVKNTRLKTNELKIKNSKVFVLCFVVFFLTSHKGNTIFS
jgi:hypothetical protein